VNPGCDGGPRVHKPDVGGMGRSWTTGEHHRNVRTSKTRVILFHKRDLGGGFAHGRCDERADRVLLVPTAHKAGIWRKQFVKFASLPSLSQGGEAMRRPTGVTILASFYIFSGGFLGILGLVLIFGRAIFSGLSGPADTGPALTAKGIALVGGVCLLVSLLNVICAIGFIKLVKWSRVLAMVFHLSWAIFWALSLVGLRSHPNVSSLMFRLVGLASKYGSRCICLCPR
jgi:hypothetical protein